MWTVRVGCAEATPTHTRQSKPASTSRPIHNDDNPPTPMHKEVLRLASLLAFVALATSRLGLIGHELVGHGGAALAFGGRIDAVKLFWFAGGWVRYHLPVSSTLASVVITMAGIAFELVVG